MIITRTPHRVSFFGGGTDYPSWYREHGGKVLGAAIDKYCYISCRALPPFFEHRHRVVYSRIETVATVEEIRHPSVRETLRFCGVSRGLEIHHDGDIPARSGMGSSSAFTVGLLKALYALEGTVVDRERLFREAIHVEQDLIGEHVGSQDQVWAACGGFNTVEFLPNGAIVVRPVVMKARDLRAFEDRLVLVYTGLARNASAIAGEVICNLPRRGAELAGLRSLVDEAERALGAGEGGFGEFGRLLGESWALKRALAPRVSSGEIDAIYERAIRAGATGGKLLGAGGGGFLVFYVEPDARRRVLEALASYLHVPFRFDFTGSEIVVYRPDDRAAGE